MTSINTNIAATTALRTLQATNTQLDQTQSRISTGLKIAEAKDNAAYWSISTSLKSDNNALSTVKDSLSLGAGAVDTAYQGMQNVLSTLDELKAKVLAASGAAANKEAIQLEIAELNKQLIAYTQAADFAGENWLNALPDGDDGQKSIVAGFTRSVTAAVDAIPGTPAGTDGDGNPTAEVPGTPARPAATSISLNSIAIDTTSFRLLGEDAVLGSLTETGEIDGDANTSVLTIDLNAEDTDLADVMNLVEAAIGKVKTAASSLGAISARIDLQQTFVTNLMDTIDKGISGLIDADMNEESTRLQALQVKQQLGVQALSIANQSAQNVLRLFQ